MAAPKRDSEAFYATHHKPGMDEDDMIHVLSIERDKARKKALDYSIPRKDRLYYLEYGYQLYVMIQKIRQGSIVV